MKSLFAISILMFALSVRCPALDLGDKAPDLIAHTWINGTAVNPAKADGKTVYVIEFWATWCPPCKRSIPELNNLYEQYKDKNVVIVGVTSEDEETVRPFVEKMQMKYLVALDTNRSSAKTYMDNVQGIPHAFIIDTNGIVVWSGHPLEKKLKESLSNVLAGTYDIEEASATQDENDQLQQLLMDGDYDKALDAVNKLLAKDRKNIELYELKFGLLVQSGKMKEGKALYKEMFRIFSDSEEDLNTLAWMAVTSPFEMCDLELAWDAATKATELSKRENGAILDTLARVYYAAGFVDLAIKTQSEAVKRSAGTDDEKSLQTTLEYYKSAATLKNRIEKSEKEIRP